MREKSLNGLCVVVLGLSFFGLTAAVRAKPITEAEKRDGLESATLRNCMSRSARRCGSLRPLSRIASRPNGSDLPSG